MNESKPVISPIERQTWTVGKDFKVEVPISNNPDQAWAWGELYGGAAGSWDKDKGVLTIKGHADREASGHFVVFATKGSHKVSREIHYDAVGVTLSSQQSIKEESAMQIQNHGIKEINALGYDVIATVYQTDTFKAGIMSDINGKLLIIHEGRVICAFHVEKSECGEGEVTRSFNMRDYIDIEEQTSVHNVLSIKEEK